MTKGRRALLRAIPDYCDAYHCAGDCGLPHNQQERKSFADAVLAAFDAQTSEARRSSKDAAAAVRRKAKGSL